VFRSLVPSRVALLVILLVLVFILNRVGRCVPEQELREAAKMNDGVGSTQNLKCISSLNQFVLSVASIKRSQYNTMERYIAIVLFCHVVIDPSDHSDPLCIDRQLAAFLFLKSSSLQPVTSITTNCCVAVLKNKSRSG
jgi:hypothetical protein